MLRSKVTGPFRFFFRGDHFRIFFRVDHFRIFFRVDHFLFFFRVDPFRIFFRGGHSLAYFVNIHEEGGVIMKSNEAVNWQVRSFFVLTTSGSFFVLTTSCSFFVLIFFSCWPLPDLFSWWSFISIIFREYSRGGGGVIMNSNEAVDWQVPSEWTGVMNNR